ncbi:Delta-1-pyrroline-5-carboxylate synthase [Platanthera guangdongensis]|uniref:Delta-1-pyrroline-5-carboxylate synthase n=1 Tax=Platanthera guangdongensis TaxID=2320717 RepID=A0ABR2LXJ6_9ASPA
MVVLGGRRAARVTSGCWKADGKGCLTRSRGTSCWNRCLIRVIASLAIRSGNGLLLKGGKEARRSNTVLHKVITGAIPENVGKKLIGLVTSRDEIPYLLKLDNVIDLVIPRGSNKLVSKIKDSTKIPVLGHADGICHVYIDKSANMEMAKRIVLDAKTDYPAACNAMETLLLHEELLHTDGLNNIIAELRSKGISDTSN